MHKIIIKVVLAEYPLSINLWWRWSLSAVNGPTPLKSLFNISPIQSSRGTAINHKAVTGEKSYIKSCEAPIIKSIPFLLDIFLTIKLGNIES